MQPTDFAKYVSAFLTRYLPDEKGSGKNTISSYRDTFVLLLNFLRNEKQIRIEKLTINKISKEVVVEFLDWLQVTRKCNNSTRNNRLAAIHSFYKFLQYENIDSIFESQRILSIKCKKEEHKTINYLSVDGIKLLLQQPDTTMIQGRRDLALLSLMYDAGARVQEIIDLTPSMLQLHNPPTIRIVGKGNKMRIVPLLDAQIKHLRIYMKESGMDSPAISMYPLFHNVWREKLTRAGINYILQKYAAQTRLIDDRLIPEKISCHTMRHSKAMHLLQAGVNIVYIRDILGHVSVKTTEVYARADSKQKRRAIESAYVDISPAEKPIWESNTDILKWLKAF